MLQPGDRVDLIVYVNKSFGTVETGTKTILQDIKVFAINDLTSPPDEKAPESITAKTVTLLMTPSEAEKATLAAEIGKIKLVVRGPGDNSDPSSLGTKLSDLFSTEKPNSDKESTDKPVDRKPNMPDFAAMLNQMQQAPRQNPVEPKPAVIEPKIFTVQIIKGTEISQAEFQKNTQDDAHWVAGPSTTPSQEPAASPAASPAATPVIEPAAQPSLPGPAANGNKTNPRSPKNGGGAESGGATASHA